MKRPAIGKAVVLCAALSLPVLAAAVATNSADLDSAAANSVAARTN